MNLSKPQFSREDVNTMFTFLKPAIQTQQISEDAAKSAIEVLRKQLSGKTDKPNVFTIKDTCQRLKLSKPSVYELIKKGKLRLIKFGKCSRILESDIDKLLYL